MPDPAINAELKATVAEVKAELKKLRIQVIVIVLVGQVISLLLALIRAAAHI